MDETKKLKKESKELRKAFRKMYGSIKEDINKNLKDMTELNKRFYELSIKVDNLMEFIENFTKQ